jgi:hypothetical protein
MEVLRESIKLLLAHQRIIWLYFLHIMDLQVYQSAKKKFRSAIWTICQYYLKENFWAGLGSNLDDICGKDWVLG